jgi:hypothetical protein
MKDGRGPQKLLLVIARQKEDLRQHMIPVGENGTSIWFIPHTTQYNFLTWNYNDLRFRQWKPDEENSLEQLARSAITIATIENNTDPNKQKSSGRQRGRDKENEGEDKGMGKKSPLRPQLSPGSWRCRRCTSVNMDE